MAQTLSTLYGHASASLGTTLAPLGTMGAAVSCQLDCLVTIGEGAQFALGAVSDADSALDDTIVAIGVGAFPSNAFGFFITSIVVGSGGRVHFSLLFCRKLWVGWKYI